MTICAAMCMFMHAHLAGMGYGPIQREAIIVNAQRESGLNPGAVSRDGRHSGLFQWNGPRKAALFRFAAQRGKPWSDALVQLTFMDGELRALPMARRFFALTSATAARALMCRDFEKAARC